MHSINQYSAGPVWPGLIVALIIAVSFSGIADHDLWTPDEPREAAIALSMSRSGNYIIPELAGKAFVEKPPLFYIIASFFLRAFGQFIGNTASLRLVSACFGLGTVFFTYLLGKIYFDRRKALIAAAILATMIGFVQVTHWLLVDNALMFFIIASIWAFAKAYEHNRLAFLPLAGIFASGAFLTKGLIGPIIIGLAWLGLFIPWVKSFRQRRQLPPQVGRTLATLRSKPSLRSTSRVSRSSSDGSAGMPRPTLLKFLFLKFILHDAVLGYHALGLIVAGLISTAWIIALAMQGGAELFREWWWTNHFGRFTGQAAHLGHLAPWYYYFGVLPVYILPWLALFLTAVIVLFKKILRAEGVPAGSVMLLLWILGAFGLLSLSATKREIYLSVLLPACALLCLYGLEEKPSRTIWSLYLLWLFMLFGALGAIVLAPLFKQPFSYLTLDFCGYQIAALMLIMVATAVILLKARLPFIRRFLIAVTICYAALLAAICPLIDQLKSYRPAFVAMAGMFHSKPEIKIAGWNLDETTKAGFYYYCDLVLPVISDPQMLEEVLQGRNQRFNGVLTLVKNASSSDLPAGRNQVIFESRMGTRRLLQVIAAADHKNRQ